MEKLENELKNINGGETTIHYDHFKNHLGNKINVYGCSQYIGHKVILFQGNHECYYNYNVEAGPYTYYAYMGTLVSSVEEKCWIGTSRNVTIRTAEGKELKITEANKYNAYEYID